MTRQVHFLEGSGTHINTTISPVSRTTKHENESKENSLPRIGKGVCLFLGIRLTSVMIFAEPITTHGHHPQGKCVSSLLGADVLPVLSTALTTTVFTHSGCA